jgi:oxygen-independent coproporphyrinogen-3 oxidase
MAGIYIHIPFCKKKCHYCNFFSSPSQKHREDIVPALIKEIELQKDYLNEEISSIYFGGGTPSLLTFEEINQLIDAVKQNYTCNPEAEITLEINPDDVSPEKVSAWKQTKVNRMSLGVQSFYANDLKYLNRVHEEGQSEKAIELLQEAGYKNLSIDLIYGQPSLGMGHWRENLKKTLSFNIPHISAYLLTVEPNTNLEFLIKKGKLATPSEAEAINEFHVLCEFMRENQFIHYEISNFCQPGFISRHNSSYWNNTPYLGIGPSAHSFNRDSRQWNCSNIAEYVEKIQQNILPFEHEVLTIEQKYNEYVMTAIRTIQGINTHFILQNFGEKYVDFFLKQVNKLDTSHWFTIHDGNYVLTDNGMLFSDLISSSLFIEE